MDLVVDANIIFAALVKDGATIDLLLEPELHLFAMVMKAAIWSNDKKLKEQKKVLVYGTRGLLGK
jgi:predicted nucleic acid-binding protein